MRKLAVFSWSFSAAVVALNLISFRYVPILLISMAACAGIYGMCGLHGRSKKRVLLICAGVLAGTLWTKCYTNIWFRPASELDDRTISMSAAVLDYSRETDYGYSVLVRMEEGIRTLLYTDEQGAGLKPGDRITTIAHCTAANHTARGEEITYYTAKGIFLWAQAYGELEVEPAEGVILWHLPAILSKELNESIDRAFPEEYAGIVRAVVTGNREHLTDRFTTSLQRTGLAHVVAVSGMHLSWFVSMLSAIVGRGRRGTALLVAGWVVLFCGVAGNTPSVSRAAIMILLLQIAPLVRREADGLTSLGLALLLLLLWNPFSAAHVGLQLSFASVAGILLVSERMGHALENCFHLEKRPGQPVLLPWFYVSRTMIAGLSATFGAMVFTIPLTAWYFGSFSLIAPISNLLTLWAVSLLFVGGMVCGLVGIWFPELAFWLANPILFLIAYVRNITEWLSDVPFASLPMEGIYYRAWLIFAYVIAGIACLTGRKRRIFVPLCAEIVTLILCICCTVTEFYAGRGCVVALDVGQGQSVLLRSGNSLILVDCGGNGPDNAGNVAADYLQSKGRSELDYLVLTHDHADHANGVVSLMERVKVHTLILPHTQEESMLRQEILRTAKENKTEICLIFEDTRIRLPGEDVLTLYAPVGETKEKNENGLTVQAAIGSFDVLLTGDMSAEGELELLRHRKISEAELLIAGHHGASTSSTKEFLGVVSPKLVAISVGAQNTYGHPGAEALQRFWELGAEVYRTDLNGTITINVK